MMYMCSDDDGLLYLINMSKSSSSYVAGHQSATIGGIDDLSESVSFRDASIQKIRETAVS